MSTNFRLFLFDEFDWNYAYTSKEEIVSSIKNTG